MKKLIDLLKEINTYNFTNKSHLFPRDAKEAAQFGIVISHKKGITDKEAKDIASMRR